MTQFPDNPGGPPPSPRENPYGTPGFVPPQQYQQPYYGYPPPTAPRNGLGIASLVLAIVALVSVWSVFGGAVLGIAAVVTGFVGWRRVKRGEANNGGVAIAGIVLGFLGILVGLVFIGVWMALWNDAGGDSYFDCLQNAGPDQRRQQQCADQFREKVQDRFGVTLTTPSPIP